MPSAAPWGFMDPALYSLDTAFHCVLLSFYFSCQCEYDLLEKLSIVSQLFIYFIIFTLVDTQRGGVFGTFVHSTRLWPALGGLSDR